MKSIIYLPGVLGKKHSDSAKEYAQRYLYSMDRMNHDRFKKYYLEEEDFHFGLGGTFTTSVTSIFEYNSKNKEEAVEVCKIYECSYDENFTKKFEKKNAIQKLGLVLIILFSKAGALIKALFLKNTFSGKKKLEILYFLFFLLLISIFALISFPAVLTSITDILINALPKDSELLKTIHQKIAPGVIVSHWITAGIAIMTAVFPKFKNTISRKATYFLCMDSYLTMGNNKLELTGKVESLVEAVLEEDNPDSLELHSYGFGGIVLIDSIFPYGNIPNYRMANEIKRVVTIRCPYDFISTYYPDYFKNRGTFQDIALESWYNIYSDTDILSSNYDISNSNGKNFFNIAELGIPIKNLPYNLTNTKNLGFWKYLKVLSFKTHQTYWGEGAITANCLYLIMERALPAETT
ncbi:hypothetical protein ACOKFD_08050 [Flagellimonas sp. S174]|uniref:hypothetical protein n=1 Tax=Flagellimonas sp. S174 TaxID=3410790 RepID=UPI003BF52687